MIKIWPEDRVSTPMVYKDHCSPSNQFPMIKKQSCPTTFLVVVVDYPVSNYGSKMWHFILTLQHNWIKMQKFKSLGLIFCFSFKRNECFKHIATL